MTASRRVLAAIAVLVLAWLVAPAAMPIYDGAGRPDEPYRYVDASPDSTQKGAPTSATFALPVRNGLSTAGFANSSEQGPQISVYIPAGSLAAPPGASTITVTATPSAPTKPLPSDGKIVSNVYTITASSAGGQVNVVGKGENQTPTLQMRAPSGKQPGPVFEHLVGGRWTKSETVRVGVDIYQTFAPGLGVWALVQASSGSSAGGSGVNLALLVPGIAILVLVGIIVAVRIARGRAAQAASPPRPARR